MKIQVTPLVIEETHFEKSENGVTAEIKTRFNQKPITIKGSGNGSLNAVSNALKKAYGFQYEVVTYQEHALEKVLMQELLLMWEFRNRMVLWHGEQVYMKILFMRPLMRWLQP